MAETKVVLQQILARLSAPTPVAVPSISSPLIAAADATGLNIPPAAAQDPHLAAILYSQHLNAFVRLYGAPVIPPNK